MSEKYFNLHKYCHELCIPKAHLDRGIFSSEKTLNLKTYDKILKLIDIYMEQCVRIKEAKIKDIVLIGPYAGYYYTADSSIELRVILDLSNVPCLKPDLEAQKLFLWMSLDFNADNFKFQINHHGVRIRSMVENPVDCSCFSVLHNKWIRAPQTDDKISVNRITDRFWAEKVKFYQFLQQFSKDADGKYQTGDLQKMLFYPNELEKMKVDIEGWLAFQVLKESGSIGLFQQEIAKAYEFSLAS